MSAEEKNTTPHESEGKKQLKTFDDLMNESPLGLMVKAFGNLSQTDKPINIVTLLENSMVKEVLKKKSEEITKNNPNLSFSGFLSKFDFGMIGDLLSQSIQEPKPNPVFNIKEKIDGLKVEEVDCVENIQDAMLWLCNKPDTSNLIVKFRTRFMPGRCRKNPEKIKIDIRRSADLLYGFYLPGNIIFGKMWVGQILEDGKKEMTEIMPPRQMKDGECLWKVPISLASDSLGRSRIEYTLVEIDIANHTLSKFNGRIKAVLIQGIVNSENQICFARLKPSMKDYFDYGVFLKRDHQVEGW